MTHWTSLDPRVLAAWEEFAATPAAGPDRAEFETRLHRGNWPHRYPPPFFTPDAAAGVEDVGQRLAALITDVPRRVFGDDVDAWMRFLGVPEPDADLFRVALRNPRLRRASTSFMRPDLLVTADGVRLVELNVSTPMGGMSTLPAYSAATGDSAFGRFLAGRGLSLREPVTAAVWLAAFGALVEPRSGRPPHVFEATADPADPDTGRRFFVDLVRSGGYDISCGLVSDLDVSGDEVRFGGRRVDVVITMYTWDETRRFVPPELTRRLIELDDARAVDFVGSPATALFDDKANLELVTSPGYAGYLDAGERALAAAHVPATFRLSESTVDVAVAGREGFVCKPSSAYGGKDVVFGAAVTDDEWRRLLAERIHGRFVCQERVHPAVVRLAGSGTGGSEVVLGPLIFGGRSAGVFLREGPPRGAAPINVKQGAQAAAVLTVAA
ncbi:MULTISPECIES: hypothetical protein [unclassified Amycolatopsis]|uniref:hypothetical protein n=1 Tax=unclassified Amycolatopsis TaxID=2618356 RepID=UPI002E1B1A78|nr:MULTISPECIES: hypothetical protein [unclassified Amycolatopsis]